MRYLISFLLESISYFLFFTALAYFISRVDSKIKYWVLGGFYLIGFLVMLKILTPRYYNGFLYNFIYMATSLTYGYFFFVTLRSRLKQGIIVLCCAATLIYYIVHSLILGETLFDSLGYVISSMGIVIMIFMYLHQEINNVTEKAITLNFDFWFSASQLIYHLGAFGIFLTYNHLTTKILDPEHYSYENRDLLTSLWGVHNVLLFLGSLLTWFGILWIVSRRRSTLL